MTTITRLCVLFAAMLASDLAASILHDDFNGSSVDTSLWATSLPFGESALVLGGGSLNLVNRGTLTTVSDFGAVEIHGRFTLAGGEGDMFKVVLRSDGSFVGPYAECANGIAIRMGHGGYIQNSLVNNIEFEQRAGAPPLFDATYPLAMNTPYEFRITDDGTRISLYISDLDNPVGSVETSGDWGDKIVLYNREYQTPPNYITSLDFIDITPIPEPSAALLMFGGFALIGIGRFRKQRGHGGG